eukprot:1846368-Rhodomonas_salina.3
MSYVFDFAARLQAEDTRTQERFRPFETPFMMPLLESRYRMSCAMHAISVCACCALSGITLRSHVLCQPMRLRCDVRCPPTRMLGGVRD